jgi:hypothetical protein
VIKSQAVENDLSCRFTAVLVAVSERPLNLLGNKQSIRKRVVEVFWLLVISQIPTVGRIYLYLLQQLGVSPLGRLFVITSLPLIALLTYVQYRRYVAVLHTRRRLRNTLRRLDQDALTPEERTKVQEAVWQIRHSGQGNVRGVPRGSGYTFIVLLMISFQLTVMLGAIFSLASAWGGANQGESDIAAALGMLAGLLISGLLLRLYVARLHQKKIPLRFFTAGRPVFLSNTPPKKL